LGSNPGKEDLGVAAKAATVKPGGAYRTSAASAAMMKDKRDTLRIVFPGKAANGRQTLLHEFVAVGVIDGEVAQDVQTIRSGL
jgi:hypothetical protein